MVGSPGVFAEDKGAMATGLKDVEHACDVAADRVTVGECLVAEGDSHGLFHRHNGVILRAVEVLVPSA